MSATTLVFAASLALAPPHSFRAPGVTSLTDTSVRFRVPREHFARLDRGGMTAVIVDNDAVDVPDARGHRAGYSGVAVFRPQKAEANENLFVPAYAGLNFEHIHDGTLAVSREKFEPRRAPLELRIVDEHTIELYQAPTPNWKLESCGRYRLLADGTLEYTFECIPRADVFKNGTIGLFWASYINAPKDRAIYFKGRRKGSDDKPDWIKGVTPQHGVDSTHPPAGDPRTIKTDPDFPLTLVNHPSKYEYTEPFYFGIHRGRAYVQMFRKQDGIWFAQSPTGGGKTNPAWDFQWFVPDYKVDQAYGFTMRAAYVPYKTREQIERIARERAPNTPEARP